MFGSFIVPEKKHLDIPGKILATVLVLTISIFQSTNATAANSLILDNGEAGTSSTGRWKRWGKTDPYGSSSLHTSKSGATYTFNVALPTAGEYQVFTWWTGEYTRRTGESKRRSSVPYDISHLDGTSTVTVNQQQNSGQWNQLGATWHFDKTATIMIRSLGNGSTSADAIMLVPAGGNTTPVVNTAPVISGTPAGAVTANEGYLFQPSASDADDGDQLTFSITNKPVWASFSASSGRLSGTPGESDVSTYSSIVISVTDGADRVSLPGFSIQVDQAPVVNTAPVISGTPAGAVTANEGYAFQPGASDADGDQLTFSISNKPAWASFSASSGRLSGTPGESDVLTYSGIVISVTDGTDIVSLPGFSIQVAAAPVVNTAPVISGAPAGSVTANEGYLFQPGASDADGDQLTFSITNKPVWASFSASSGRLSGTPTESDVLTYSGIVIAVTDGADIASLGTFSIAVNGTETQTGSVTLNWAAPVARTDGSPITMSEIAGFTVHYGTSTGSHPNILNVDDGSATSATIVDLQAGTYYLVVTTRDSEGRESGESIEIAKVVN